MKRKTFGRFAAAGMAAVSAISAMSIVASADVTITKQKDDEGFPIISGSAKKITWEAQKITHSHQLNLDTGKVADRPVIEDGEKINIGSSKYALKNTSYYRYDANAGDIPYDVETEVANASRNYKNAYTKFENDCSDYYFYYSNEVKKSGASSYTVKSDNFLGAGIKEGDVIYYGKYKIGKEETELTGFYKKDKDGNSTVNISSLSEPDWADYASVDVAVEYVFINKPKTSTISVGTLAKELNSYYVIFNADNTINKVAKPVDPESSTEDGSGNQVYVITSTSSTDDDDDDDYRVSGDSYYIPAGYRYGSSTSYYVADNDTWYPNRSAVTAAGYSTYDDWKTSNWNSTSSRAYFDPTDGNYYSYSEAYNGYHPYAVAVTNSDYTDITESDYAVYKVGSLYYYNWSEAYSAAGGNRSSIKYIRSYTSRGNYFSRTTGYFYSSYYDALTASGGNSARVVTLNGTSYVDPYSDPSYYWFMNGGSSNSNANLGGSSVKIGNRNGWNYVRNYVAAAKSGATLNVSLNGETTIPSAIMSALDGKNVTVNFTLSNGSVISFNGKDISDPKEVSVNVVYNAKEVPSKLVAKAKSVNDGVSTAQLTISSNTFGGEAGLNVKFNANREGYTAKIYRYNSTKNSLQYIDKATIGSNGRVSFDGITQGGEYVIVVC